MRLNDKAVWLGIAAGVIAAGPALAQDGPPPSDGPQATSDRSPDRYDEVGYAMWYGNEHRGNRTASGVPFDPQGFTAAHRSLPIGAYVEVTALDTGRTVLVQINDRGPFTVGMAIDLSQAAAQAIGVKSRAAVRIRRVTPTPADQNALKNGQSASPRLDTPPGLLAGLRAKLSGRPVTMTTTPTLKIAPNPAIRSVEVKPHVSTPVSIKPPSAVRGRYYVQVGVFSSEGRAADLAKKLGGFSAPFNNLWRVRTGPFGDSKSAAQARDAAAARGYGDARIVRQD